MEIGTAPGGNLTWPAVSPEGAGACPASGDPNDAELLPQIQQGLSLIEDLISVPLGLPFGNFPGGRGMAGSFQHVLEEMAASMGLDFDDLDDDEWFDDDLDEDDDEPPVQPKRQLPAPKPKRRGRKKK